MVNTHKRNNFRALLMFHSKLAREITMHNSQISIPLPEKVLQGLCKFMTSGYIEANDKFFLLDIIEAAKLLGINSTILNISEVERKEQDILTNESVHAQNLNRFVNQIPGKTTKTTGTQTGDDDNCVESSSRDLNLEDTIEDAITNENLHRQNTAPPHTENTEVTSQETMDSEISKSVIDEDLMKEIYHIASSTEHNHRIRYVCTLCRTRTMTTSSACDHFQMKHFCVLR